MILNPMLNRYFFHNKIPPKIFFMMKSEKGPIKENLPVPDFNLRNKF